MRRAPWLVWLPVGCWLLAGCWTSAQHGELIDQRLTAVESDDRDQQAALLEQRKQLAEQIPRIDAKLAEMTETLEKLNQATHRSGADVGVRLDELEGQMQSLRGLLEETQHRLDQMASSQDSKLAEALGPQRMADLSAKEKAAALAPADRGALLTVAGKQLAEGDSAVARELFAEYLRRYPNDSRCGEAQYGQASAYLKEGKYKEAALGFQKVPDQYPASTSVCDARLGLGLALEGLKLLDDARAALEETLRHCASNAAVAKQARAKLAELKELKRPAPPKAPPKKAKPGGP